MSEAKRKGRPKVEKIAVEDEFKPLENIVEEAKVLAEQAVKGAWVVNGEVKKCNQCGKELHGWAVRQDFIYCPFCGSKNMGV